MTFKLETGEAPADVQRQTQQYANGFAWGSEARFRYSAKEIAAYLAKPPRDSFDRGARDALANG